MGIEFLIFLILGCLIGVIAGLLGVGGGTVVVPAVAFYLTIKGAEPDLIMKMALGTSFATVAITSLSSAISHHLRGSVKWELVVFLSIGTILGVAIGSRVVSLLSDLVLQILFSIFLLYTIIRMFRTASKKENDTPIKIPKMSYCGIGVVIGFLASFVGIGGGMMIVPVLARLGHPMRYAIATSSAVGVFLALSGAISYLFNGYGVEGLPQYSAGYIFLPALIGLSLTSALFAPVGARLVYILPVKRIRYIFAIFLTFILLIFLYNNFLSKLI